MKNLFHYIPAPIAALGAFMMEHGSSYLLATASGLSVAGITYLVKRYHGNKLTKTELVTDAMTRVEFELTEEEIREGIVMRDG